MLTQIEFIVKKDDLMTTLRYLYRFFVDDEEIEEYESDMLIRDPKRYFSNKVRFELFKTHARLSVLSEEGNRVEKLCSLESNVENVSFCIPFIYLFDELDRSHAESFSFKEEKFFGFNVFEAGSGKHLFDVDAHAVNRKPLVLPKFYEKIYTHTVSLEHDTLIKVLKDFPKYTALSSDPYTKYIWLIIDHQKCRVIASSGCELRQEIFPTFVCGHHEFSLLGEYASRILDMVVNWSKLYNHIDYNNTYLRFHDFIAYDRFRETIEIPLCESKMPNFQSVLEKRNISFRSSVQLKDFQSVLRRIQTIEGNVILMHFFPDHVNLYKQYSSYEDAVFNFIDADGEGEYTIKLEQRRLEAILEEIHTDKILFTLVDDNLLYINNQCEPLFGNIVRILATGKLQDEDLKLLTRGDTSLNTHESYIEKYLSKNDDKEDSPEDEYATIEEMKAEALFRMKEVIEYTDLIYYFEETGLPQVYEPPYGASYSLEEDELENVRKVESDRQVLVWGVIRCNMIYNRQEVTVDCMLHVSQNKDEWDQEREDLRNGFPFVYTVMKEYPVIDHGHINVYKSKGGTLLRG